jgi:hypothetical protein
LSAPAPIVVTALFGAEDQAHFDALRRRHYPPARNHVPAHLTLFRHLPPNAAAELKRRMTTLTRGVPAPKARAAGLIALDGGVAYRIDSPELVAMRGSLAEAFGGLLTPQDRAAWRPHVTIQNKAPPGAARALLAALQDDFRVVPVAIAGLASWRYRGGPWEPLSRHMFA